MLGANKTENTKPEVSFVDEYEFKQIHAAVVKDQVINRAEGDNYKSLNKLRTFLMTTPT